MYKIILLIAFTLSFAQCTGDEEVNPVINIDESYYKALTMFDPYQEILHDPFQNHLYIADRNEGEIVCYDYVNHKTIASASKDFFIGKYELAIYSSSNSTKIYLAENKSVKIYQGGTLALLETVNVLDDSDPRFITSLDAPFDDLLAIGLCNSSGHLKGTMTFDLSSNEIIDQSELGGNCLRVRSFKINNEQFGVIGVGFATSHPSLVLDIYSNSGQLIENRFEGFPQGRTSLHLLKTTDAADYFITSDEGNFFNKEDLSFSQSLNSDYEDIIIDHTRSKLYGVSRILQQLHVINIESLNLEENTPLEGFPVRGFLDEDTLLIIFFNESQTADETEIYISKIDLN